MSMEAKWRLPQEEREQLLKWRRHFHQYPELSWEEVETGKTIAKELIAMGYEPKTEVARFGVIADIGENGPMVVLRADMDALPIEEESELPFRSKHPGKMHACGHDVHMACLLAVAKRFQDHPPTHGRVRFLFQPAEEGAKGADVVIEEGVLSSPDICAIFGAHIWSQLPTGTLGVVEGAMMGSVDVLEIYIEGKGGHAAEPHDTSDCIAAGAYLITHLQSLVTRKLNPLAPVVLSVCQFQAGTAFNVIAEKATLIGTIRTLDLDAWKEIPKLLEETIQPVLQSFGCKAEIVLKRQQNPLMNHPKETAIVQDAAKEWLTSEEILPFRTLAGEDFSTYLEHMPGCFFFVGAGGSKDEARKQAPHHNPRFLLDEDGFDLVVRLMEGAARKTLEQTK